MNLIFFKFDLKFHALLDLKVIKRVRIDRTHEEHNSACLHTVNFVHTIQSHIGSDISF